MSTTLIAKWTMPDGSRWRLVAGPPDSAKDCTGGRGEDRYLTLEQCEKDALGDDRWRQQFIGDCSGNEHRLLAMIAGAVQTKKAAPKLVSIP